MSESIELKSQADVIALGYSRARQLPDGTWLALERSLYTLDLYIITDKYSWREKWMYEDPAAAIEDFERYSGTGDPEGLWVKHKPSDRWHPSRERGRDDDSGNTDGTD